MRSATVLAMAFSSACSDVFVLLKILRGAHL
jgi:hypothetical protein